MPLKEGQYANQLVGPTVTRNVPVGDLHETERPTLDEIQILVLKRKSWGGRAIANHKHTVFNSQASCK